MDYKKYSLEQLENWIHDALSSAEASPHEIYSTIREAVREDYLYYKNHSARAFGLLELLSGHRPVADDEELYEAAIKEREYYEGVDTASYFGSEYYKNVASSATQSDIDKYSTAYKGPDWASQYTDEELDAMCERAATEEIKNKCIEQNREYNVREEEYYNKSQNGVTYTEYTKAKIEANSAWNDGWTKQHYQKIVDKYEGKQLKTWVLPVEQVHDDYFVSFPDDLLKAANLKEGDTVEWADNEDGSYLLKKVEKKTLNFSEAIKAGWEMTDDGIWLPPQD